MELRDLPVGWTTTRDSLQRYAHAATAAARAGAAPDPRWSHVAMVPSPDGFSSAPVALADGTQLDVELDLVSHELTATAGDDRVVFDLTEGPSPREVGEAIVALAEKHGSFMDVDRGRFDDRSAQVYDSVHAEAFLEASKVAIGAMTSLNSGLSGEVVGPHLWPHGFDIATEWISDKTVVYEGSEANAQIQFGWYPHDSSYIYVNPWPFDDDFASVELPGDALWHREGWQGAKLDVPTERSLDSDVVVELATAIHDIAGDQLGA